MSSLLALSSGNQGVLNAAAGRADNYEMTEQFQHASRPDGNADATSIDPQLRRVLDAAGVAMAVLDVEGHVVSATSAFASVWNRDCSDLVGLHLVGFCPERDQADVLAALVRMVEGVAEVEHHDLRMQTEDGGTQIHRMTFGRLLDGSDDTDRVVAVVTDVTTERRVERRRRREVLELTRVATEDEATGLPNQRGFESLLASALRRSGRTGYPFSLMRCDLDGLAGAAAEHGPAAETQLLDTYSARLAQRLRPSDSVSRLGGDSFMVIAEDLGDEQDAAGVAYRLLSAAIEPVVIGDREITLPMTIGIVVADGAASTELLLQTADRALAEARKDGQGGFRIVDVRPGLAA